jgi:threonine/homoserine/homoserine lactone efflux protein
MLDVRPLYERSSQLIPIETAGMFVVASVALALAPGPDNIFVLAQSAMSGRIAGIIVTLGLCTGLIFHTLAVAFGVAVVFQTSAVAFTVLKLVGAAYLLYLAWMAFRVAPGASGDADPVKLSTRELYVRGVVMNVANPKVAIFFLAFLPQFAEPANGSVPTQIAVLGALFMACAFAVFSAIAWAAGSLGAWFQQSERAPVVLNRIAGTVFVALALRLAVADR